MKSISLALCAAFSLTTLSLSAVAYTELPVTPGPDSRNGDECRAQVLAIFGARPKAGVEAPRYLLGCASMDTLERYSTLTKAFNRLATAKQALKANKAGTTQIEKVVQPQSTGPAPTAATCTQLNTEIAASQKKQDAAVNDLLPCKAKGVASDWKSSNANREEALLDLEMIDYPTIGMSDDTFRNCTTHARFGVITQVVVSADGSTPLRLDIFQSKRAQRVYSVGGVITAIRP